ncbi:MAG TPA: YtxH domain-containing protein [Candidatus Melainabacteria bacterium]|jgi:gas vesicle protein|nr:YtxH domain-containing protein [Candidatus Melainabacteria bacterium]HIN63668.1 YtxH domain-containing protein [Candidatus Obscuribacterales bacterium]
MSKNANDERSSDSGFAAWFLGLLLGAAGGVTVALLVAPKSGSEVRGVIKETANHLPEKASELVDDSIDLYASALNYCQVLIEDQTLRLKRAVAAGKLAAAKKREELEMGGSTVLPFQHR